MATGFAKLSSDLLTSTLLGEDRATILVFLYMLAGCDSTGFISGTAPALARHFNVSLDEFEHAIDRLTSPDLYSRNPTEEGRRLRVVPGGWVLVTYQDHRDDHQGKPGSRAAYMRGYRGRKGGNTLHADVTRDTEAEAEADGEEEEEETRSSALPENAAPSRPSHAQKVNLSPMSDSDLRSTLGDHYDLYRQIARIFGTKKFSPSRDVPILVNLLTVTPGSQILKAAELHREDSLKGKDGHVRFMKQFSAWVDAGLHLASKNAWCPDQPTDGPPSGKQQTIATSDFADLIKAKSARAKAQEHDPHRERDPV